MSLSPRVSLLSLYGLSGLAAIEVAYRLGHMPNATVLGFAPLWQAFLLLCAAIAFFLLVLRRIQMRLFWEFLFGLALFFGVWSLAFRFFPAGSALSLAAGVTLLPVVFPRVVSHNLFVALGAIGAALHFAPFLSPEGMVIILVGLSLYDMLVAGPEGPLVELTHRLAKKKVLPGWIIPKDGAGWWARLSLPLATHAAFLGAGDVIVPLTLVIRVGFFHRWAALIVLGGALAGLYLLSWQRDRHPRAGLPWLAAGAIIPFLFLRYFGFFL